MKDIIEALEKNEIMVNLSRDRRNIAPNCSKMGGKPYLPTDFSWPTFSGDSYEDGFAERPLSFLCQINLEEVKELDKENLLPKKGMLYFFYEMASMCWGFDPEDEGCARVYYYDDTEGFAPIDIPRDLAEEYLVKEYRLNFSSGGSYPSYEELDCHAEGEFDWDEYDEILEDMGYEIESERHKLLGYANLIQGEMLTQCERIARGLYCGDAKSYRETPVDVKEDIKKHATDWQLLFQMAYIQEDDFEMLFGDCGNLYFYIKKEDLANKNFDKVWLILQCG